MNRRSLALPLLALVCVAGQAFSQATTNPAPAQPAATSGPVKKAEPNLKAWWNDAVFYEVFVRSFKDSSAGPLANDGIGDIRGLIEKLDYLNDGDPTTDTDLGVTALWLMPINPSPSYHGYDVIDYKGVNPQYGTMDDFKELVQQCHKRGIKIIIDFVPNHCSEQNPWFKDALDPASPKHDWFIWSISKPDWKGPWNGEVWHIHPTLGAKGGYYYGLFWKGMPDLNYRNPEVTNAMYDVTKFWFGPEVGVDGFRIDAIRHLIEEGKVQENTPATHAWLQKYHDFYKGFKPDALTVGEVWSESKDVAPYIGSELDLCFEFWTAFATIDSINDGKAEKLEKQWQEVLKYHPYGQYGSFLSNHDHERVMSRFKGDQAKMKQAATLLLTSPGVPFLYYGEEIGMLGEKPDEKIRTPMQWASTKGKDSTGGFTTGKPWEPLNDDVKTKSVEAQAKDKNSLLSLYKKLIRLRQAHKALRTGTYTAVETGNPAVYAFAREEAGERFLVLANLSGQPVNDYGLKPPFDWAKAKLKAVDALTDKPASSPGLSWRPLGALPAHATYVYELK